MKGMHSPAAGGYARASLLKETGRLLLQLEGRWLDQAVERGCVAFQKRECEGISRVFTVPAIRCAVPMPQPVCDS